MSLVHIRNTSFTQKVYSTLKTPSFYILLAFATVYSLISVVNHYNYRTYAFDLGIYNNCLYQYGHFHKNHYPYLHYMFTNFLSDHFSLYTVILSPLYYLFGTATLLYVQILSILFGAVGVFKFVQSKTTVRFLPEIAMIHYLSFFGIFSALSFDYHDNVVSAMLVPWFLYYFDQKRFKLTILFAVLIVIGKENMPIWLAFICAGLFLLYFKDKQQRRMAWILAIASLLYTVLIIKVVMPAMDPMVAKNGYNAFKYSVLGANGGEMLSNLIHHPIRLFKFLYFSHITGIPELKGIKKELYICLLFSGIWMLLKRPQFLIMLIPIIAQKVYNDDYQKWGISSHYSIELVPIVVLGFYYVLLGFKNDKLKLILSALALVSTAYISLATIEKRDSLYYIKENVCFYSKEHYECKYDKAEIKKVISMIPDEANLSCINFVAPHVSFRKNIYQFPDIHDAEYILLVSSETSYPLRGASLEEQIRYLQNSADWTTVSANKGVYLFKKKD